jgi:hypothetical protein
MFNLLPSFAVWNHPLPSLKRLRQTSRQTRRELELDKQYFDEVVEKYAPGSR